jgi:hypothetical protein
MLTTSLLLTFVTSALASPWAPGGPPSSPWGPPATTFFKGHDLSSLRLFQPGHSAPLNVTFKDAQHGNVSKPADEILAAGGMNTVRLRLWVDPTSGDQWVCSKRSGQSEESLTYVRALSRVTTASIIRFLWRRKCSARGTISTSTV